MFYCSRVFVLDAMVTCMDSVIKECTSLLCFEIDR